jgi:hypothetical protein
VNDQTDAEVTVGGPSALEISVDRIEDILGDLPGGQSVSPATRWLHQELYDARRRGVTLIPAARVSPDRDIVYGPPKLTRAAPAVEPERFHIVCTHDVTGTTGVGVIAEGCRFSDGSAAVRRLSAPPHDTGGWRFYDSPASAVTLASDWRPDVVDVIWLDQDEPA